MTKGYGKCVICGKYHGWATKKDEQEVRRG